MAFGRLFVIFAFAHCTIGSSVVRLRAVELRLALHVHRVPSSENVADDPSRESYTLLQGMEAKRWPPRLSQQFREAKAWESLSIVARQPSTANAK